MPTVLFADVIELEDDKILDLRVHKDLCEFEQGISEIFWNYKIEISGIDDDADKIIMLRALLISYYADTSDKKLVIGNFRQRPQPLYEYAIEFSNSLDMIFGIETIYCVKDKNIIENVREGGESNEGKNCR